MVKFLNWLVEKLMSRRKKPWARLVLNGISKTNEVKFEVAYNKAFIRNLDAHGLTGANNDETVQNFLFGTFMAPKSIFDELDGLYEESSVESNSHPNLSSEASDAMKGFRFRDGNAKSPLVAGIASTSKGK